MEMVVITSPRRVVKNEVVLNESQFERLIRESCNKDVELIEQSNSSTIVLDTTSLDSSAIMK